MSLMPSGMKLNIKTYKISVFVGEKSKKTLDIVECVWYNHYII